MKSNLNILHYCIFIIYCKMDIYFAKVLKFKRDENINSQSSEAYLRFFIDEFLGINILNAGTTLASVIFFLFWGFWIFITKLFFHINSPFFSFPAIISFLLLSYLLYYFLVSKNNEYLKFFPKYKTWDKPQKIKYLTRSILFIIFTICFFIGSLFV